MPNLFSKSIRIVREDGVSEFFFTSKRYLERKFFGLPVMGDMAYYLSRIKLHLLKRKEKSPRDVVNTTFEFKGYGEFESIESLQKEQELKELVEEIQSMNPTRIMEIGTANGGTFYTWNRSFDSLELAVSLDLPGGQFGGGYSKKQANFFKNFSDVKKEFIRTDSHSKKTKENISNVLDGKKLDFLFIDGDHTYEGVKQDFEMYKDFVREGGIIAFHDIVDHPDNPDCNVDRFWNELKEQYETEEIIEKEDQTWAGIGILYYNS
jgi:predicted O-methyltransferase YrrM